MSNSFKHMDKELNGTANINVHLVPAFSPDALVDVQPLSAICSW